MNNTYYYYKNSLEKRRKAKKIGIRCAIIGVIIVFLILTFNTALQVTTYDIYTKKVTSPVKIALLTDLHSEYYGEEQQDLVSAIDAQKPDIVLYGGDIADDKLPNENTQILLEEIGAKYPSFYVTGNHEIWTKQPVRIKEMFKNNGVTVLDGRCTMVTVNKQRINICGVDDPEIGKYDFERQLDACADILDPNIYTLLLTHRPEYNNAYLQKDWDLILSGHTHGGQWRIPFTNIGAFADGQGFFPKYSGGIYDFESENTKMIVGRGLVKTTRGMPRIFNRPEVVIVNLLPEKFE